MIKYPNLEKSFTKRVKLWYFLIDMDWVEKSRQNSFSNNENAVITVPISYFFNWIDYFYYFNIFSKKTHILSKNNLIKIVNKYPNVNNSCFEHRFYIDSKIKPIGFVTPHKSCIDFSKLQKTKSTLILWQL